MKKFFPFLFIIVVFVLVSCQPIAENSNAISLSIIHDGKTEKVSVQEGLTVKQALASASLTLGTLDQVEPGLDEIITAGETIKITRVKEDFVIEETTLPFESQTVKNESLPAGQTLLVQAGVNGIQSITYRVLNEDGVEKSRTVVKTETTKAAQPEIIMLGIQSPYKSVAIQGVLAYISSSNAWIMESNTGNRREVVSSGDLDGRIFTLSLDHKWLLFSKSASKTDTNTINSLWAVNIADSSAAPVSLNVTNVVHYAEWVPGKEMTIAYSTVEPRSTAPGWQANNDLKVLHFNESGKALETKKIIDTNSGGIYGWWGTIYSWSPDASEIAYARPDSIGLVDSKSGKLSPLVEFTPYQTEGDWAWVPGICWSQGHSLLYFVNPEENSNSTNTAFDLSSYILDKNIQVKLQINTGMFSYPSLSPVDSQNHSWVAYLTATLPDQSNTSRYELRIMDRDGSNMKKLYPGEGIQGVDPQQVVWSPTSSDNSSLLIAFIAQGNLLFVDPITGSIQQVTGDGSISKIDWK